MDRPPSGPAARPSGLIRTVRPVASHSVVPRLAAGTPHIQHPRDAEQWAGREGGRGGGGGGVDRGETVQNTLARIGIKEHTLANKHPAAAEGTRGRFGPTSTARWARARLNRSPLVVAELHAREGSSHC